MVFGEDSGESGLDVCRHQLSSLPDPYDEMYAMSAPVFETPKDKIRALALARGFQSCGFLRAERFDEADARLEDWLQNGFHGEMAYMERYRELRVDARILEPGTQTVMMLTVSYSPLQWDSDSVRIAAYAVGEDYHVVLRELLLELAQDIADLLEIDLHARPIVDSAPYLERESARRAGLGWVGKSSMLVHPRHGTYTLLCGLLLDIELEPDEVEQPDRCGKCERCIDACPTGALVGGRVVDGRRCISYLTIEIKGAIPREMRSLIGGHVFGCDICQAVCPWNRFSKETQLSRLEARSSTLELDARELLRMTNQEFKARFKGTPLERSKRKGLARNAAVVLGNLRRDGDFEALGAALEHDEALVRGHVAWAIAQWKGSKFSPRAIELLTRRFETETDEFVRDELSLAIESFA